MLLFGEFFRCENLFLLFLLNYKNPNIATSERARTIYFCYLNNLKKKIIFFFSESENVYFGRHFFLLNIVYYVIANKIIIFLFFA